MQVFAPAKINLSLKIFGRRDDGFHEIETLIVPISLCDEIRIEKDDAEEGSSFAAMIHPFRSATTIWLFRLRKSFFAATKLEPAISIELKKKIPHGAGLGGGSSDAATTLLALNDLFKTNLPREELAKMGATSDQTFRSLSSSRAAICRGRGELVTPIRLPERLSILLLKPAFAVPTQWAYSRWQDSREIPGVPYAAQQFADQTFLNDLERPVFEKFLFLAQLKMWLLRQPEVGAALMSGSGSTMFAVMRSNADAELVAERANRSSIRNCGRVRAKRSGSARVCVLASAGSDFRCDLPRESKKRLFRRDAETSTQRVRSPE